MEEILKRITQTRKQRGYTLENMAIELGIAESGYRKIENNEVRLTLDRFLQIAKILNTSVNELLGENSHREYHQNNNEQGTITVHQEFENFYQENREITQKLINSMESNINYLHEEIFFLRNQLAGKYAYSDV